MQAISLVEGGPDVLVQLASAYGLQLGESLVDVEISLATEFEAGLIGVPLHAPVFLLSAVDLDTRGSAVSFTRAIVRADYFRFSVGYPLSVPVGQRHGRPGRDGADRPQGRASAG